MLIVLQVIIAVLAEVLSLWRFYTSLLATLLACLLVVAVLPDGAPVVVIGVGAGALWQFRAPKAP